MIVENRVVSAPRAPSDLLKSSAFLLKRLGMREKERALQAFEPTGFGPYHYAILSVVDREPSKSQGAIADALGYDRSQLVGWLDELEDGGLVERKRDPDDRRRQSVALTPEGKKALARFRAITEQLEDELLAPLDERQRTVLHELLLELAAYHDPRCAPAGGTATP